MFRLMKIDLLWCKGVHVIVEDERGLWVTNQTNGCCCGHPETKGFLIPMPRTFEGRMDEKRGKLFDPLENYLNFDLTQTKDQYELFLRDNGFKDASILDGHEAWLHFSFKSGEEIKTGVLTWENSD